jgi:hypothetical protein
MFSVEVGDEKWVVKFDHSVDPPAGYELRFMGATQCTLERLGTAKAPWINMNIHVLSLCSISEDGFNKRTGEKVALARAMEWIDRDKRQPFWDKFHEVNGGW